MKKTLLNTTIIFVSTCFAAHANTTPYVYGNTISAHNISIIQRKITQSVFDNYSHKTKHSRTIKKTNQDINLYGRAPMYGTMPMYGEYNDDGRNGGDYPIPVDALWTKWQHINDNIKLDNLAPVHSDIDIITIGLNINSDTYGLIQQTWGLYTGYTHNQQNIPHPDISAKSNGGYFGFYHNMNKNDFIFNINANIGLQNTSSETNDMNCTNFWAGFVIDTGYKISLDSTFYLYPRLHTGYTWITSDSPLTNLRISNFNMFEITPGIDFVKHVTNSWYGKLGVQYIITMTNGGDITYIGKDIPELNYGNYFEYGISLSKSVSNMTFSANIGRHDGARYGWFGGIKSKYIF